MMKDVHDFNEYVYALLYLVDWFDDGIWPDIHGYYGTLEEATAARASKIRPEKYHIHKAYRSHWKEA